MQVELALISRKTGRIVLQDVLPDIFREHFIGEALNRSASTVTGHFLFQFVNRENFVIHYYHIKALENDEILLESSIPTLFLLAPTHNLLEFAAGGSELMLMHERYFNFFYVPTKVGEMALQKDHAYSGIAIHFSRAYIDQHYPQYPFAANIREMLTKKDVSKLFPYHQRMTSDLFYLVESLFTYSANGASSLEMRVNELIENLLTSVSEDTLRRMVYLQQGAIHKIYAIKNHLLQHIQDRIQMSTVASKFGISIYAMTQGFQEIYGYSPSEFLFEERMRKAKLLLQSKQLSKAQVAEMVGYDNVDSFRVAYKRYERRYGKRK